MELVVPSRHTREKKPLMLLLVASLAGFIALASARPYAGSWNDGSRLATIESLIDQGTLAIDRSIFVEVPKPETDVALPYPSNRPVLLQYGTQDKLWINGHFYSDKSPVPAFMLAGFYKLWQELTGLTARGRPDAFCWWMTIFSSGLAYVVAVTSVYRLGCHLQLLCDGERRSYLKWSWLSSGFWAPGWRTP
jgi:hypothetical protein